MENTESLKLSVYKNFSDRNLISKRITAALLALLD
jgi:hypothetical protein